MEDIELIFSKYYKYVKHYALSLCYDETLAEDITQETFYKAFKNIDKFKNECRIESWLCRIAHNEFVSLKRKKKTENIDDYTSLASFDNIVENADDKECARKILEISTELSSAFLSLLFLAVFSVFAAFSASSTEMLWASSITSPVSRSTSSPL